MKDNISPEEKLLRLIKGQKKQNLPITAKPAAASENMETVKPNPKISLLPLLQRYSSFLETRKIILGVFIAACLYLTISLVYPWFGLRKIKLPKTSEAKFSEARPEPKEEVKPLEFYQQGIANRSIFGSAGSQAGAMPASAASVDLMKDINLVGVISGANPQAVIEDKKTQKTYYVTKGQFIGEMQVEDIQEGKIIINYRGQRYELYL